MFRASQRGRSRGSARCVIFYIFIITGKYVRGPVAACPGSLPFVRWPVQDIDVDRTQHGGRLDPTLASVACDVYSAQAADRADAWVRGETVPSPPGAPRSPVPPGPGEAPPCTERAPGLAGPGSALRGQDHPAPASADGSGA